MKITDLFQEVAPFAPGAPDPALLKYIRNAAIEFCMRTRLWKYEYTATHTAGADHAIITPDQSALNDIERIAFDGKVLEPKSTTDLDIVLDGWRTQDLNGIPSFYTQLSQGSIRLVPDADGELYFCMTLKPGQTSTLVPDFLIEYRETLGHGALSRLLLIPGQPYSSPEMAMMYKQRFDMQVDSLSLKGFTGQINARPRTKAKFF